MLFLAVFCGFLAEYQLEHIIENQREKKYAVSLLEDLVNDTVDLSRDRLGWNQMITRIDTVRNELEKEPVQRNHILLYRNAASLNTNNTFLYHDRTINQLKNAGNFRLIRSKEIADSLVEYDSWVLTTLKDIEQIYGHSLEPYIRQLENKLFNNKFFELRHNSFELASAASQYPEIIRIVSGKKETEFEYYNALNNLKNNCSARLRFINYIMGKATRLIELIKKDYHLSEKTPLEK